MSEPTTIILQPSLLDYAQVIVPLGAVILSGIIGYVSSVKSFHKQHQIQLIYKYRNALRDYISALNNTMDIINNDVIPKDISTRYELEKKGMDITMLTFNRHILKYLKSILLFKVGVK
ncbi:MAG: hypothetical protein ACOCRO_04245, partial [Halanaerobiales bacterium]